MYRASPSDSYSKWLMCPWLRFLPVHGVAMNFGDLQRRPRSHICSIDRNYLVAAPNVAEKLLAPMTLIVSCWSPHILRCNASGFHGRNGVIGRTVIVQRLLGSHSRTGLFVSECGLSKPPEPPLSRTAFDRAEDGERTNRAGTRTGRRPNASRHSREVESTSAWRTVPERNRWVRSPVPSRLSGCRFGARVRTYLVWQDRRLTADRVCVEVPLTEVGGLSASAVMAS